MFKAIGKIFKDILKEPEIVVKEIKLNTTPIDQILTNAIGGELKMNKVIEPTISDKDSKLLNTLYEKAKNIPCYEFDNYYTYQLCDISGYYTKRLSYKNFTISYHKRYTNIYVDNMNIYSRNSDIIPAQEYRLVNLIKSKVQEYIDIRSEVHKDIAMLTLNECGIKL